MEKKYMIFGDDKIIFKTFSAFRKKMEKNREELKKFDNIFIKDKRIILK